MSPCLVVRQSRKQSADNASVGSLLVGSPAAKLHCTGDAVTGGGAERRKRNVDTAAAGARASATAAYAR